MHDCVDGVELYVFTFTINSKLSLQNYVPCTMYIYMFCVLKTSMEWAFLVNMGNNKAPHILN